MEPEKKRRLVVGTDFSAQAQRACEAACALARGAELAIEVVHAVEPHRLARHDLGWASRARSAAVSRLEDLAQQLERDGFDVEPRLIDGPAAAAIVGAARRAEGDLVVVGSHGRHGLERCFLGSVAEAVVRSAPCPVLTVEGAGDPVEPKTVVAAIDLSEDSAETVGTAAFLAGRSHASLHLVHAIHVGLPLIESEEFDLPYSVLESAYSAAEEELNRLVGEASVDANSVVHVETGVPYEVITDRAKALAADLIVVGAHSGRRVGRLLGSTAERVLRHAPCSVWTVRKGSRGSGPGGLVRTLLPVLQAPARSRS